MAYKIRWAHSARTNLKNIVEYIGQNSPRYADVVGNKIAESTKRLSEFPFSGRMIPEERNANAREIIVYSYRVMYRVSPGVVTVFRIVHARQGYQSGRSS